MSVYRALRNFYLPLFAWKVIYPVGGAAALHILNVILGGVNAWMVGLLSRRIGHSAPVAALVTATFLFFPAAVEPIAWNSGIFDVAAVFFKYLSWATTALAIWMAAPSLEISKERMGEYCALLVRSE